MKEVAAGALIAIGIGAALAVAFNVYKYFAWKKPAPLLGVVRPNIKSQREEEVEDEFFG